MALTDYITFNRADPALYFGSDGLLHEAAAGEPRDQHHVYDPSQGAWVNAGLLIEPERTNELLYSFDMNITDRPAWQDSGAIHDSQSKTSILSGQNANQYSGDGGAAGITQEGFICDTVPNALSTIIERVSTDTNFALYVQDLDNSQFTSINFDWNGNTTVDYSELPIENHFAESLGTGPNGGELWRVVLIYRADYDGTNARICLRPDDNGTGAVIFHCAQLEKNEEYPTQPILTTDATVTRSADNAYMDNIGSWYNNGGANTIVLAFRAMPSEYKSNDTRLAKLGDIKTGDSLGFVYKLGGRLKWRLISGGEDKDYDITSSLGRGLHKVAIAYGAGQVDVYFNGSAVVSGSQASPDLGTLVLAIGMNYHDGGINQESNIILSQIKSYPRKLTNTKLEELTSV